MGHNDREVTGVGGWMLLLLVTLGLILPALAICDIFATIGRFADTLPSVDRVASIVDLELPLAISKILACWLIALLLLVLRRWGSIRIAIAGIWIAVPGAALVEIHALMRIPGISIGWPLGANPMWMLLSLLYAAGCTAYLLWSKRVAGAYRRPGG